MPDSPELNIRITTTADTAAVADTKKAIDGLGTAATDTGTPLTNLGDKASEAGKKSTQSTNEAAHSVHELGKGYLEGADAGRVLSEVAQGNISQIGRLGYSIKALGLLLKTNLIGGIFILGSAALQVLIPLVDKLNAKFGTTKESAEDLANKFKQAEAFGSAVGKVKMDVLQRELDTVKTKIQAANELFREQLDLQGKRDEVAAATKIAQIQNNPLSTDSEKAKQIQGVETDLLAKQRDREDALRAQKLKESANELTIAETDLAKKKAELKKADEALVEATKALTERLQLEAQLRAKKSELTSLQQFAGSTDIQSPEQIKQITDAQNKVAALEAQLSHAASVGQLQQEQGQAKTTTQGIQEVVTQTEKDVAKTRITNESVKAAEAARKPLISETRAIEDEGKSITNAKARTEALKTDAETEKQIVAKQKELQAQLASAKLSGDTKAINTAQAALNQFTALTPKDIGGAAQRLALEQNKQALDAQRQHIDQNSGELVKNTSALSDTFKALNAVATAKPNQGGTLQKEGGEKVAASELPKKSTITTSSGQQIDVTSANSVAQVKQAESLVSAPAETSTSLDAASTTIPPKTSERQPATQSDNGTSAPTETAAPLDAVAAAAQAAADQAKANQDANNAGLAAVAEKIASTPAPEPLSVAPIGESFAGYHQQNMVAHQSSKADIAMVVKQVGILTGQLASVQQRVNTIAENQPVK